MTAISDRAAVSLALECASRLVAPPATVEGGSVIYHGITTLLRDAETILAWHDAKCAERAKKDALRVNAPGAKAFEIAGS